MLAPYRKKPISRREALEWMVAGSSTLLFMPFGVGCTRAIPLSQQNCFPQSVASGDPRSQSVILWTRVVDSAYAQEDYSVRLEVAEDSEFGDTVHLQTYTAFAELDHCIRVKIEGLKSDRFYYYRFTYQHISSKTGRTRTAPEADEAREITFAFVSGQDYVGRYYNAYAHMLQQEDLDFIVHLGDYVYETTGDPTFQVCPSSSRQVVFDATTPAEKRTLGACTFYAANSRENYRQLYRTYRSDTVLQKIHERFPMIAMWDDHEYHDDYAGLPGEKVLGEREQHARRAFLEYMPVETGLEEDNVLKPDNKVFGRAKSAATVYRDFVFGASLHLIMSDYRTYRSVTPIPMDAFMGTVFADKSKLIGLFETKEPGRGDRIYQEHRGDFAPYIDLEQDTYQSLRSIVANLLLQMYVAEGKGFIQAGMLSRRYGRGKIHAHVANEMIQYHNRSLGEDAAAVPLIFDTVGDARYEALDRGLAYLDLGKVALVSTGGLGTTSMVVKEAFDLYAQLHASSDVFGDKQFAWIRDRVETSPSRVTVFASSVSMTPMAVDLTDLEALPARFRKHYYINLDQYDGFPSVRKKLLACLREKNSMIISGDIHANFVTDHEGITEVTGTSISSATADEMIRRNLQYGSGIPQGILDEESLDGFDLDAALLQCNQQCRAEEDPDTLQYADTQNNGYVVVKIHQDRSEATLVTLPASLSQTHLYDAVDLNKYFSSRTFLLTLS